MWHLATTLLMSSLGPYFENIIQTHEHWALNQSLLWSGVHMNVGLKRNNTSLKYPSYCSIRENDQNSSSLGYPEWLQSEIMKIKVQSCLCRYSTFSNISNTKLTSILTLKVNRWKTLYFSKTYLFPKDTCQDPQRCLKLWMVLNALCTTLFHRYICMIKKCHV